jgi:hypothetical protein
VTQYLLLYAIFGALYGIVKVSEKLLLPNFSLRGRINLNKTSV